jgi:hypothetical protein
MDDKGLSSPISGPRVSSTDLEFAPDSLLEGTGIRTIGPAEGARRPPRCRLSFAPYFGWSGIRQRRLEPVLKPWSCHAEPMVRIRFPPAGSHVRTRHRGLAINEKAGSFLGGRPYLLIGRLQLTKVSAREGEDSALQRLGGRQGAPPDPATLPLNGNWPRARAVLLAAAPYADR